MEVITWNRLHETRVNEGITRKMFWGENMMVARWELAAHTTIPVHDHISEQITIVQKGKLILHFPPGEDRALGEGDMFVIPPKKPHGVTIGPEDCVVVDLFSPIREDFLQNTAEYLVASRDSPVEASDKFGQRPLTEEEQRGKLLGYLRGGGIKLTLEDVKEIPLDLLSRYTYERGCITLGELRRILGLDRRQAKELLREWKHGDDHSESSLQRTLQRMVIIPEKVLAILSGAAEHLGRQDTHGPHQDRTD